MNRQEILFAESRITLIDALVRPTIADKVLGSCDDPLALHRLDHAPRKLANQIRLGSIGFIRAAPARVQGNCQCRSKNPVNAGGTDLSCGGRGDAGSQCGVTRGT